MAKFKYVILAIAIAIVFALFVGFGIATFYKATKYEDFCKQREFKEILTKESCEASGGKWNPAALEKPVPIRENQLLCTKILEKNKSMTLNCETYEQLTQQGYCDAEFYCREAFQKKNENYSRNVFIIATGAGIIALIVGFALKVAGVSAGLMGGGILSIIYGTMRYWSGLPDYGRFIILGITLAILIWLGYKRMSK